MHLGSVAVALALIPALSWAQLSPNTVTVTASSGAAAQPDQAVFSVAVFASLDQGLDDIAKALSGSGVIAADLIGVSASSSANLLPPPPAIWTFQLAVPLASAQTETATLTALQKSMVQNNGGLSLSFTLQNAQTSGQQFQNCDLGGLVADARAQAQTIAGAAGMSVTSIVSLQGATSQPASVCSLAATFALGFSPQPEPHTITITASRTLNPLPDQVSIAISVNSSLTAALADVSIALAGAGISGVTFSGVSTVTDYGPLAKSSLQWSFTLTAPLAALKDTFAQLGMAQQTISKQNPALSVSFSVQGLQVSPQAQPVCPQSGLVLDAAAQSQKLATAAGLSAGPIVSLSTVASPPQGDFSAISSGLQSVSSLLALVVSNPATVCSLAVQFQLN